MGNHISLTRLFFIDDVLIFYDVSLRDAIEIHCALELYCNATKIEENEQNPSIMYHKVM
jgi:hypothetical protein